MKTRYKIICSSLAIAMMSATSLADEMNADGCAAALSPTGKTIFEAVAPSVEADTNLKKLVKETLRPLVLSGKLKRKDAKANVLLAGKCLHLLQQEKAALPQ